MAETQLPTIPTNTDLSTYKPVGLNLVSTYWSPERAGEAKRLLFIEIKADKATNEDTGEEKILPTAIFVDPSTREVWRNASSRLVGALERAELTKYTPLEITYNGKVKNTTNAFSSDSWSVFPLVASK